MDMAIVNAVNRAESFPPPDPWQSGTEVNYYYFGHYLVAFLVRLTGVDPAVGFNLGSCALLRTRHDCRLRCRGDALRSRAAERGRTAARPRSRRTHRRRVRDRAREHRGRRPAPAGLGWADEPNRDLRLVGALARHRGNRQRVPVLQLPPRRPARTRDGHTVRTRLRRLRDPARAVRPSDRRTRRPVAAAGRRARARRTCARLAVRDEQLRLPDGVPDRGGRAGAVGARAAGTLAARARVGRRLDRRLAPPLPPVLARLRPPDDEHRAHRGARRVQPLRARLRLHLRPRAVGRARALRESLSDLAQARGVGWLRPPVLPRAARSVAALRADGRAPRGRGSRVRHARDRKAHAALSRALAAHRGGVGSARERRGRLPARRVRRHRQLPLQHRLQDGLPGVVPAFDRRRGRRVLERTLARTPRAGRLARGARGARRSRPRLPHRRVVLEVGSFRRKPDARRHALARAAQRRTTRPRSTGCALGRRLADAARDSREGLRPRRTRACVSTFTGLPAVMGWAGHEVQWGHDPGSRVRRRAADLLHRESRRRARAPRRYGVEYVFVGDLERSDYPAAALAKFERRVPRLQVGRDGRLPAGSARWGRGVLRRRRR